MDQKEKLLTEVSAEVIKAHVCVPLDAEKVYDYEYSPYLVLETTTVRAERDVRSDRVLSVARSREVRVLEIDGDRARIKFDVMDWNDEKSWTYEAEGWVSLVSGNGNPI